MNLVLGYRFAGRNYRRSNGLQRPVLRSSGPLRKMSEYVHFNTSIQTREHLHATFQAFFVVTVCLMAAGRLVGLQPRRHAGLLSALWITAVLGVMEVSLSFDNAVVNASVLKDWNEFWQKAVPDASASSSPCSACACCSRW